MDANKKTIVVFSGDLDNLMAAFIIGVGAAAMGNEVTMFFTFWGLNALRKSNPPPVKKDFMSRMFAWMMPRGANKVKLSKLNMGGLGTAMMKSVMKGKNVQSLEQLIADAQELGVKMIACTTTMEIMGLKREELIDGIDTAGVAAYLGNADEANVNLFI